MNTEVVIDLLLFLFLLISLFALDLVAVYFKEVSGIIVRAVGKLFNIPTLHDKLHRN